MPVNADVEDVTGLVGVWSVEVPRWVDEQCEKKHEKSRIDIWLFDVVWGMV